MYIHISSYCVGVVKSGSPSHHIKSMAPVQPQEECRNISWIFGLCEAALGPRFKFLAATISSQDGLRRCRMWLYKFSYVPSIFEFWMFTKV